MTVQLPWLLNPGDRYCPVGPAAVAMMKEQESSQVTEKFQAEIAKLIQKKKKKEKKSSSKAHFLTCR